MKLKHYIYKTGPPCARGRGLDTEEAEENCICENEVRMLRQVLGVSLKEYKHNWGQGRQRVTFRWTYYSREGGCSGVDE